jgi:hypothetical protein
MCISSNDQILYAGTMSGDIVKIRLNCPPHPEKIEKLKAPNLIGSFALHLPKKPLGKDCQKYQFGVREILILPNDKGLVIGAGDGTVDFVDEGVRQSHVANAAIAEEVQSWRRGYVVAIVSRRGFAYWDRKLRNLQFLEGRAYLADDLPYEQDQ